MTPLDADQRARFDALVEDQVALLPYTIQLLLQETPLLVEDHPAKDVLEEFGMDASQSDEICGLYSGIGLTDRSVDDMPEMPETITIYRSGIVSLAGGWDEAVDAEGTPVGGLERISTEIRTTILHEVGHHFGLDEDDLDKLGFA